MRRGDDRAFEELYSRYQRRIAAYVCGMVNDYGRAEDITQEVFVSALRRMRQTERPIAFKPWVYEIAKNACIDAYRRGRRAEEVSYDADDRLSPSDHVRLVATGPEPDVAVDTKQDLDHLCGAFGGLSESHHEILVLRELEGLSYKDIGERMGMSRPAVESTLFRARKRLGEEYDELASGARCLRIQGIIAGSSRVGRRDQRKLARHLSHCQSCRRLAARAGLDVPVPARRRITEKIAALLPLPAFARRGGGDEPATAFGGGGGTWMAHAPSLAEAMSSGWSKGAAGLAALVVAGAGVGVSTFAESNMRDERGTGYRATEAPAAPAGGERSAPPRVSTFTARERTAAERTRAGEPRRGALQRRGDGAAARSRDGDRGARRGGGGAADAGTRPAAGGGADAPSGGGGSGGGSGGGGEGGSSAPVSLPGGGAPRAEVPTAPDVAAPTVPVPDVQETTDAVTDALPGVDPQAQTIIPDVPKVPDPADVTAPVTDAVDEATAGLLNP